MGPSYVIIYIVNNLKTMGITVNICDSIYNKDLIGTSPTGKYDIGTLVNTKYECKYILYFIF